MIKRSQEDAILAKFHKGKAILLFGARQCGKSTLVEALLQNQGAEWLYLNADEADVRESLTNTTSAKLKGITGINKIVFIDEAQRIPNIGLTLKFRTPDL